MSKALILLAAVLTALTVTGTAAATAPTRETNVKSLSFVDDETCAFPIAVTVERIRTTTTFENGDQLRHVQLIVTSSANGKTWTDRDAYNVFIAAASPGTWTIVGEFTHARLVGAGTILLESGRIAYDVESDTITDLNPGPHGTGSDPDVYSAAVCAALAP